MKEEIEMGNYIAVFVDGEYKNVVVVQAEDIDDADYKLKQRGWEGWSSLEPIEFDSQGFCFAIVDDLNKLEVKCCSCDYPIVRNDGNSDYCGNCGDDLE